MKDADAYAARASEWLREGDFDRALKDYDQAIRLRQDQAPFWNNRGFTWHMKGYQKEDRPAFEDRALADYAEAICLDPSSASAINNRAWLLATTTIDRCRNGSLALEGAKRACELTDWKNAGYLDTLSCAYAEIGDFEQAIRWQKQALEDPAYRQREGENPQRKLALFGKKQPYRE